MFSYLFAFPVSLVDQLCSRLLGRKTRDQRHTYLLICTLKSARFSAVLLRKETFISLESDCFRHNSQLCLFGSLIGSVCSCKPKPAVPQGADLRGHGHTGTKIAPIGADKAPYEQEPS